MLAGPAFAQDLPDKDAVERAERHYETGKQFHEAGDYDQAIQEFLAAYALTPRSALLFNIGRSYEKKGSLTEALDYYRKVLLVETEGDLARWSREAIARIFQRQAAEREKPPDPPPPPPPPPPAPSSAGQSWTIAGIAVGGAGLVSTALAIKFGLDAKQHHDALRSPRPRTTDDYYDILAAGNRAETTMYVLYSVGGVLVVTGSILLFRGLTIEPEVSPDRAGVTLRGQL
jgi:tetratricopeptide (TPR) repeat protein